MSARQPHPCLHCAVWDAIRAHAARVGSCADGQVLLCRETIILHLGMILGEVLYSNPDVLSRMQSVEDLLEELMAIAVLPGAMQPRTDAEVVSWQ